MPTYEYRCPNGHDFEKFFRSISSAEAESAIACPVCGAIALRQMSSAGLMFKGSGFYLTDYGKGDAGPKKDGETTDRTEKSGEKAEKAEKSAKAEKGEKAERSEKQDKPEKKESTAPSGVSAAKSAEKKKKAES